MAKQSKPVDVHVGSRMRLRRTLLGFSQEKVGNAVGLSFQQIQKYERGANRIGAGRLYQFANLLDVPVSFFYDDMPDDIDGDQPPASEAKAFSQNKFTDRETLKLVRAYYAISNPAVRHGIYELARSIAQTEDQAIPEES